MQSTCVCCNTASNFLAEVYGKPKGLHCIHQAIMSNQLDLTTHTGPTMCMPLSPDPIVQLARHTSAPQHASYHVGDVLFAS